MQAFTCIGIGVHTIKGCSIGEQPFTLTVDVTALTVLQHTTLDYDAVLPLPEADLLPVASLVDHYSLVTLVCLESLGQYLHVLHVTGLAILR